MDAGIIGAFGTHFQSAQKISRFSGDRGREFLNKNSLLPIHLFCGPAHFHDLATDIVSDSLFFSEVGKMERLKFALCGGVLRGIWIVSETD